MSTSTPSGDESPEDHIHHTLRRLEVLYATGASNPATNEIVFRFAFLLTKLAEISSRNAAKQEALAIESEKTTKENLKLQSKVVELTSALFWLTLALTFVAAIQVFFIFFNRP